MARCRVRTWVLIMQEVQPRVWLQQNSHITDVQQAVLDSYYY